MTDATNVPPFPTERQAGRHSGPTPRDTSRCPSMLRMRYPELLRDSNTEIHRSPRARRAKFSCKLPGSTSLHRPQQPPRPCPPTSPAPRAQTPGRLSRKPGPALRQRGRFTRSRQEASAMNLRKALARGATWSMASFRETMPVGIFFSLQHRGSGPGSRQP